MTELVLPDVRYHASWAKAVREFEAEGVMLHGSGMWDLDTGDLSEEVLAREVERLLAQADPVTELPPDRVPCTYLWIVDGSEFVGFLAIRHELNDFLLEEGGHIGFSVRPSRRREGHATRALRLALHEARALGLDRVLVTCDHDNEASRGTIEANCGVLEDRRGVKLRYWIDLTS